MMTVQTVRSVQLTWKPQKATHGKPRRQHVAAPRGDMCQAVLDVWTTNWANPEVTRVTTVRVTRGMGDVSSGHGRMTETVRR